MSLVDVFAEVEFVAAVAISSAVIVISSIVANIIIVLFLLFCQGNALHLA